jgi:hypothetical protein
MCEAILAYLAVPTSDLPSLKGICAPVFGSLNLLARPKSIM